jgi:hypothetical protein
MNCAKCSQEIPYNRFWRGNNHIVNKRTFSLCNECDDDFRKIEQKAYNLLFLMFMDELADVCPHCRDKGGCDETKHS